MKTAQIAIKQPVPQTTDIAVPALVLTYIANLARLTPQIVEKKLLTNQFFDIPGKGHDIDTHFMEEVLKENDFYQTSLQKLMKDDAMKFVRKIITQWSEQIAKNNSISKSEITNYVAKALPFGSYVLDLRSNSSDIDLVVVCPNFINRQTHFFGDLYKKLQGFPEVTDLSARTNARVPILTFQYKQINIDLSFCQLATEIVPRDIQRTISSQLINSITDIKSQTALLGRKNNLMILQLTGKQVQNFKETLRVIKVWAKNRGISSNSMGYLGGISWAIMLAKICQIFPNHKPIQLFAQFFIVYRLWDWKTLPVQLIPCEMIDKKQGQMCVVAPGSSYNSTQRVNKITFKVLMDQIRRGSQMIAAKKQLREICKKPDFFNLYPMFIQIDICGQNKDKQEQKQYKNFQGFVESKVLSYLDKIIKQNTKQLQEEKFKVIPNPKLYKKNDQKYPACYSCFFGVFATVPIKMGYATRQWAKEVDKYRGLEKTYLNLRIFKTKKEEMVDIEIVEVKKKEEKMDPRLLKKKQAQDQS